MTDPSPPAALSEGSHGSMVVPGAPPPPMNGSLEALLRLVRKVVVTVMGVTVILAGIAMLVLPGPGWVTIFVGLGILATEFAWAARVYRRVRRGARTAWDAFVPQWIDSRLPAWARFGKRRPCDRRPRPAA